MSWYTHIEKYLDTLKHRNISEVKFMAQPVKQIMLQQNLMIRKK